MKKILSMITLTVLMVALAGSCTKNFEERLDKTEADAAALKAAIGKYGNLQSDIAAVLDALKKDVGSRPASEQQSVWNCINALQNQKSTFDAAIKTLEKLVGEESVSAQIDAATAELISEYNLESLAATLQELKDKVNAKYDVTALEKKVEQMKGTIDNISYVLVRIAEVKDMIQSVSIAPAYSDGSVKADEENILTFKCIVSPAEALEGEKNLEGCFTLYANYVEVLTKKGKKDKTIPLTGVKLLDKAQGVYEITADVTDFLPSGKAEALTVALDVKTGSSDFITGFVKVTAVVPEPEYVEINGLKWATMNLGATTVAGSLATCAGDYYQWGSVETLYESIPWNSWPGTLKFSIPSWKSGKEIGFEEENIEYKSDDDLPATNDVVNKTLGGSWRMPTSQEFMDLYDACLNGVYDATTYKSTSCDALTNFGKGIYWCGNFDGVAGVLFCDGTSKLFFPATGLVNSYNILLVGSFGYYWSSTISGNNTAFAYDLSLSSINVFPQNDSYRSSGFSIRPVKDAE